MLTREYHTETNPPKWLQTVVGALILCVSLVVNAEIKLLTDIGNAFKAGSPEVAFRLRYENAKQQDLLDANATTLRSTLGYETAEVYRSTIKLELVDVASFFGQDYNPGVSDLSKPEYSLINDPRGAGLTEAKLIFNWLSQNTIIFGRQYIQLDNERFIGKNDYRQYPQSFDALSWHNSMLDGVDMYLAYLTYVNTNTANGRSDGGRRQLRTTLINLDWHGNPLGNLVGYAYINNDHSTYTNSNTTVGVRFSAPRPEADQEYSYIFEYALQHARGNNPINYKANYVLCNLSRKIDWVKLTFGYELLSGNADAQNKVFITPLGSVDNFDGLAEVFTTLPSRGLQDIYATFGVNYSIIDFAMTYHYFRLDKGPGSKNAGQELDITAQIKINEQLYFNAGYAKYNQKNQVAPSTQRIWLMLTAHLL